MIRMLVTDLDNTLLHSDKTLSDDTVKALEHCRQQGVLVVFATARSASSTARITARFQPDYLIGCGGALVERRGEELYCLDIQRDLSDRLIRACVETPEFTEIYAINRETALTNDPTLLLEPDYSHYRLWDFAKSPGEAFLKISVNCADPAIVEHVAAGFPALSVMRFSGEDLYRFANPQAEKWPALQLLLADLQIDPREVVAFGDDHYDIPMMRGCGTGVAVANAIPQVKEAADTVCPSNDEDGVAQWIWEYMGKE